MGKPTTKAGIDLATFLHDVRVGLQEWEDADDMERAIWNIENEAAADTLASVARHFPEETGRSNSEAG